MMAQEPSENPGISYVHNQNVAPGQDLGTMGVAPNPGLGGGLLQSSQNLVNS